MQLKVCEYVEANTAESIDLKVCSWDFKKCMTMT